VRTLVALGITFAVVLGCLAPARAKGRLYGRLGQRVVLGAGEMTSPTLGVGYRWERGVWGLDASAANLQVGRNAGVHGAASLGGYRYLPPVLGVDLWIFAGLGWGWTQVWTDAQLSRRSGQGFQVDVALGAELARTRPFSLFVRLGATAPLYALHDIYGSQGSAPRVVALDLSLGVGF